MRKIAVSLAIAAGLAASPALAAGVTGQEATNTIQVSLNISTACTLTTNPMSFGTVTTATGGATASSDTRVNCTPGAAYTVNIDDGANAALGVRKLKSTSGAATVDYNIYTDGSRTVPWTSTGFTGTGNGADQTIPVLGKLTQLTQVGAGTYQDLLTVTLHY
ncbi:Csu type fimbrial protein [Tsuneonella sp. HG094]